MENNLVQVDFKEAGKVLTDLIKPMADGEIKRFEIGQERDSVFVERKGDEFLFREETNDAPVHSVGSVETMVNDVMRGSQGVIFYEGNEALSSKSLDTNQTFEINADSEKRLSEIQDVLSNMLNNEQMRFQIGDDSNNLFQVHRDVNYFTVRLPDANNSLITDGAINKVTFDMMALSGGELKPISNKWIIPEKQTSLKEILKLHEGLPHKNHDFTASELNSNVEQYRFKRTLRNDTVEFSFAGEKKLNSVVMEKHPFLPKATRDMLLDQAATGQALVQNNQMGMSLGG